ncbi:hypothetical protein GFS24_05010 [Chitinophaga sp. SYP-B3965]|uniref:DUF6580 family putative transport protein n=1 Tax=Chitinophaga sp. SYP-B3965 TaxID=2663120 RepID=UPI001299708B|nr:DUF6580 family putative transport protein [Chitinophaga sp. SYP-B3965]MRG44459.1 hypothetical protein [Chitinophaga sp. SYP-B3965]
MKKETTSKVLLIAGLIFLTILGRLITNSMQIYNFTAIGAGALFAGVVFKDKRYAYIVPLAALFLSDVFFELFTDIQGFYGGEMFFVYFAFVLTTFIGTRIKKANAGNILLASICVGVMFFLLSNLGTFLFRDMYPHTFSGLMTCYLSAIPFYKNDLFGSFALNTVMGNVFYSGVLFGAYALLKPVFVKQPQLA